MVAAAIIGGAVVATAGTAVAGSEAAGATKDATNASISAQQQAQQKQEQLNAPYAAIGTGGGGKAGAIDQYQTLLGLTPGGMDSAQKTLASTPGYQFAKSQGLDATKAAATSMGLGLSGNTLEGLDKFSTGLADSTYREAVGNAQNAVTIGQNAAAGTGSGVLQTGANIGSTYSNQGQTLAGIDANTAAGISKSIGNAGNQLITENTLKGLQNPGGGSYAPPTNTNNSWWGDPTAVGP